MSRLASASRGIVVGQSKLSPWRRRMSSSDTTPATASSKPSDCTNSRCASVLVATTVRAPMARTASIISSPVLSSSSVLFGP